MNAEELKRRTKNFALEVIKFVETLPKTKVANIIGVQLLRSATSVGANYRAVCRAKSKRDFIFKLGIVEEEADETLYWIELLIESGLVKRDNADNLLKEADELTAIFSASCKSAREKVNRQSEIKNRQS